MFKKNKEYKTKLKENEELFDKLAEGAGMSVEVLAKKIQSGEFIIKNNDKREPLKIGIKFFTSRNFDDF